MQLVQLQREISQYLTLAGISDSRREAALLLAYVLGVDLLAIYSRQIVKVSDETASAVRQLAGRRARREPLAYIIGLTHFMDLQFHVGPGVLVPRPDSEVLVESALALCENIADRELDLLDACTGTGCIGISLASRLLANNRLGSLCLTEIAPEAAHYTRLNLDEHPLAGKGTLVMADLLPPAEFGSWHLIVANPPYIASDAIDPLMPEVSQYEPRQALDGGTDGLVFYRRLIAEAAPRLKNGGYLLFEHGYDQAGPIGALLAADGRYDLISAIRDYGGQLRVSGGRLRADNFS